MRKVIAVMAVMLMGTPAFGKDFGQRGGQHYGQQSGHYYGHGVGHGVGQRYGHNSAAPWVAGAIGLGILGIIIASQPKDCWQEFIGYDRYGRRVYQEICN